MTLTQASAHPPAPTPPSAVRPRRRPSARIKNVPRRMLLLTGATMVALALFFGSLVAFASIAEEGLNIIGHETGPQVVATADLYFALSDMDAQIADVLLIGNERDPRKWSEDILATYDKSREAAGLALLKSAKLAGNNQAEQEMVQSLLDGLGRYERLVSRAVLLDQREPHPAGPPHQQVIDLYRQATDLMQLELLPQAYNLTLESGTIVRHTYEERTLSLHSGWVLVLLSGIVVLGSLVWLQVFLTRRFRRVLNPALLIATGIAAVYTLAGSVVLGHASNALLAAKQDGFDSILTLARARAVSNNMHGDQTRYLLDPVRKDTYEQVYFDKAQSVLYAPADNLAAYYTAIGKTDEAFLGFLGKESNAVRLPGQQAAVDELLAQYREFQQEDRKLRAMSGAVNVRKDPLDKKFGDYDSALVKVAAMHRAAFDRAVDDGEARLHNLGFLLPAAVIGTAILIVVGIWPRFSEYR
ncbi:hypothetical protein ACQP25_29555 [Microtetraspora malaysiensis]|uniref:hypothetical protein n=1 Tax=Microtetraspora malaysiensis TaxID=161358 RepID=UPI003D8F85E6